MISRGHVLYRRAWFGIALCALIAGCATMQPPMPPLTEAALAPTPTPQPEPPAPARPLDETMVFVEQRRPEPPMPDGARSVPVAQSPADVITYANNHARQQPDLARYINAIQKWEYQEGRLYQIYVLPYRVTVLLLSPDEKLWTYVAGVTDENFWLIKDTVYGSEEAPVNVITVLPKVHGEINNLFVLTTKRTYAIELISPKAPAKGAPHANSYMVQVAWTYPEVEAQQRRAAQQAQQEKHEEAQVMQFDMSRMQFHYAVHPKTKPAPAWTPVSVFDDGTHTYIRFPDNLHSMEAPVLYVHTRTRRKQLVNYRRHGLYYIVDRVPDAMELRVGGKNGEADIVQIRKKES